MTKNTILFVDNGQIKIVFGNKLKTMSFDDALLDHNQDFLETIFANSNVVMPEKVSILTREKFDQLLEKVSQKTAQPQNETPATKTEANRPRAGSSDQPQEPRQKTIVAVPEPDNTWIVSTSDVSIIIDDLFTGRTIARGNAQVKEAVALLPGKPVDLSGLDQESVTKSNILKRMLRNGLVRQVSFDEAMDLNGAYEQNAPSKYFSVHDVPNAGMVTTAKGQSEAERLKNSMFDSPTENDLEITASDMVTTGRYASNEDSISMSELMRQMDQQEAEGNLPPPKRRG